VSDASGQLASKEQQGHDQGYKRASGRPKQESEDDKEHNIQNHSDPHHVVILEHVSCGVKG
jgi:hypothetical protein